MILNETKSNRMHLVKRRTKDKREKFHTQNFLYALIQGDEELTLANGVLPVY